MNKNSNLVEKLNKITRVSLVIPLLFFMIMSISLSSGEIQVNGYSIPPTQQNTCNQLLITCANCTFVNVTAVHFKNSTFRTDFYFNGAMERHSSSYNYTFCNNNFIGTNTYDVFGDPDGELQTISASYEVTATGELLNGPKSALYTIIFIIALILFGLFITLGLSLPSKNNIDEMTGYILQVSNLKYVKIISWFLAYISFSVIMYFGYVISNIYLDIDFVSNILRWVFYATVAIMFPGFLIFVYVLIANAVRDAKLSEALEQGLRMRE